MGKGDAVCAAIAEKQFGLIARDQAVQTGMSERAIGRRLANGRWLQVLPGVYRLAGAPTSWEQSVKAATLWGGNGLRGIARDRRRPARPARLSASRVRGPVADPPATAGHSHPSHPFCTRGVSGSRSGHSHHERHPQRQAAPSSII